MKAATNLAFFQNGLNRRANLREISYVLKQEGGFDGLFINLPPSCYFRLVAERPDTFDTNYIDYRMPFIRRL